MNDLYELCQNAGLRCFRKKHPLGAGTVILANADDEVVWEGASTQEALLWCLMNTR